MSIYDQIAEAASKKDRYVNTAGMARPQVAPKPRFQPRPTVNPAPVSGPGISASPAGSVLEQLRANAAKADTGGGDGFNPLGSVGKAIAGGFGAAIDAADLLRRTYQGVAGEVGDVTSNFGVAGQVANRIVNPFGLRGLKDNETGERDQSFDFGEIRERITGDDALSQGFLGMTDWDDDLPGFARPALGFAGDLLTDPLTYLTAGTVKAGSTVAGTAARTALAQQAVKGATTEAGKQVPEAVARNIAREVGTRGAGGLTTKAVKRAGGTVDDLVKLGLKPDWGVSVGVGSKRAAIPGTAKLGESIANVKGSVKAFTGSSRAGKISRELFTSAKYGEAKAKQAILSGAANAPEAAAHLALLGTAKANSWRWFDETGRVVQNLKSDDGKHLYKMTDDEAKSLTLALESGDFSHPLVPQLTELFQKAAVDLQSKGVEFNVRQGYMPHRFSEQAIKNLNAGDNELRMLIDDSIDKPEIFQKIRQSDKSIAEVNAEWRKNHDYDLLETDARVLVAQYLGEGQEAIMKAGLTGQGARDFGSVTPMGRRVDTEAAAKDIEKLAVAEAEHLAKSVANRKQQINKAIGVARKSVAEVSQQVTKAKSALAKAEAKVTRLQTTAATAERQLQTAQEAYDLTDGLLKTARGKEKAALTRKVNELQVKLDSSASQLQSAQRQLANAEKDFGKWADDVRQAEESFATYEKNFSDLMDERIAMDAMPVTKPAVQAAEVAERFAEKKVQAAEKFAKANDDVTAAETTVQWLNADVNKVVDRLTAEMAELDDFIARVDATKKRGRPTTDSMLELRDQQRQLLSDIRDVLRTSTDPDVQAIAKLEAQALVHDAAYFRSTRNFKGTKGSNTLRAELDAGIDLLNNPDFQKYIVEQTDEGFTRLKRLHGPDEQINEQYRQAIETSRQFIDPSTRGPAFRGMQKAMRAYSRTMNWWKGWALASPGFVFRNWYSGMFAMYLDDALNPQLATRFSSYMRRVQKDGPEAAKEWSLKKFGPEGTQRLDDAYNVAAASGWGLTSQEFSTSLVGSRMKANPLSADMPLPYAMRHASSEVEAFLRGGHALAVLERGGTFEDALQRVEKFHFNYRDISDFDRAAKQAAPFWTFWSRNMGLQAQVYARRPDKINRSYINMKRNIEESSEDNPDGPSPWYLRNEMMGILTPFGSQEGKGRMYLTPDIPSARFPGQMAAAGDNPVNEIIQQLGPGLKLPIQGLANKDFFLDRDYNNSLTTYDSSGEVPRFAPKIMQLPGVRNIMDVLPGTEIIDDQLLMQDNTQAAVEGLNPVLGRIGRALPGTERQEETFRQYWLGWLGSPTRWNDPGSQAGALATQDRAAQAAADKVWERVRLEKLVSEGGG